MSQLALKWIACAVLAGTYSVDPAQASPLTLTQAADLPAAGIDSTPNANITVHPPPLFLVRQARDLYDAGYQHGRMAKDLIHGYLYKVEL